MTCNLLWLCELRTAATMLDAALVYARNGWAVFPLLGKLPPKDFSGGFHNATTDEGQIRKWWARWPDGNIGWPVAPGWFALDEDPRHFGNLSRTMLELVHGPLPFTLRATTGSGGTHWIYTSPVPIHQRAGWWDGIDTRSAGRGYLLVEPSIHPDTDNLYRWHSVVEPAEAPAWLVDAVRVRETVQPKPYVPPASTAATTRGKRWAQGALRNIAREVAESGEGTRNDTLNRAAWRMGRMVGAGLIDEGEVRAQLRAAGIACGLPEREVETVLR